MKVYRMRNNRTTRPPAWEVGVQEGLARPEVRRGGEPPTYWFEAIWGLFCME
jgi:hypothetical protein